VVIYCRHAPGLVLRAGKFTERDVGGVGGVVRTIREWHQTAEFKVAGPAKPFGGEPRAPVVGGYAMTPGCPKELWERWLEDNKDSLLVKNKIVFASDRTDYANGEALERRGERTGLEPLVRDAKDPRVPAPDRNRIEPMTAA
jgi:hypothetical protein